MADVTPLVLTTRAQELLDADPERAAQLQTLLKLYGNAKAHWVGIRATRKRTLSVTVVLEEVPAGPKLWATHPGGFEVHFNWSPTSGEVWSPAFNRGSGVTVPARKAAAEGVWEDCDKSPRTVTPESLEAFGILSPDRRYLLNKGTL